jgi:D-sedoheptulose 7-phosphate isomerase
MRKSEILKKNIQNSVELKAKVISDENFLKQFSLLIDLAITQYQNGGRLYIAGNGGSAADAQHLAAEFVSKLAYDRAPLPAEALTVDSSIITAIGNDYGFDQIFARQLEAKATKNDIFLAITTSGNSLNILTALKFCSIHKIPSVLFGGNDGGQAKNLANINLIVPSNQTTLIQEIHILLAHSLCECVESHFF